MMRSIWLFFGGWALAIGGEPTLRQGAALTPEQGAEALKRRIHETPDLETWQSRALLLRQGIEEGLGLPTGKRRDVPAVIRHSLRSHPGYTVENVAIEAWTGWWVCGNLYLPDPRPDSFPVVLMPHGHIAGKMAGSDGRFHPHVQFRGGSLARCGVAALSIDMVGYGDSRLLGWDHKSGPWEMRAQVWNGFRALDWLISLKGADASRVAVTGESGGGTQTLLLAALDPRVTLSVPCVMVSSWFYGGCNCESGLPVHVRNGYETSLAEVAALAAPREQLVISCGADWTRYVPDSEYPFLRHIYSLQGATDRIANAHFPGEGHDYGVNKRQAMRAFLLPRFGLREVAEVERGVAIEGFEEMRAFDSAHPPPQGAVQPGAEFPPLSVLANP